MGSLAHPNGVHHLVVGTFNTPELFLIAFEPLANALTLEAVIPARGNHSWLGLNDSKDNLLATCWTEPPSIASYAIDVTTKQIVLVNCQDVQSRSGYVTVGDRCAYTAGGPSGEVIGIDEKTNRLTGTLQEIEYIHGAARLNNQGAALLRGSHQCAAAQNGHAAATNGVRMTNGKRESILDFGGLRHGAHSVDLSPDRSLLYVADIGRNCVWVHRVDEHGLLSDAHKVVSPRTNDGPRHVWPHPNGEYVYVLQEHSCMVDVFRVERERGDLTWVQGERIIPDEQDERLFWADEVRTVASGPGISSDAPEWLVASTRGLESGTKGYVALLALTPKGLLSKRVQIWQTPTSGGWANAVEPCKAVLHAPKPSSTQPNALNKGQYVALTDSEQGLVMMLAIEERLDASSAHIVEVARLSLGSSADGKIRGAATAVWL